MHATRLVVLSTVITVASCAPGGPKPVIEAVSPAVVCTESVATATITGSGFGVLVTDIAGEAKVQRPKVRLVRTGTPTGDDDGTEVDVELSYESGTLRWISEGQLEIDLGPELGLADGAYDVVVELASGKTGTLGDGLISLAPPVIEETDPLQVCADAGVTPIAFVGTNFVVAPDGTLPTLTAAEEPLPSLGAEDCQPLAGDNGELCTRILTEVDGGAYVLGGVQLTLANPGSNACATSTPGQMEVVTPPTVTSVSPEAVCNGADSDTIVTIKGTRFLEGTQVLFGGVAATDVELIDDTTLQATLAAGTPEGRVDVQVLVPSGCDASLTSAIEILGSGSVFFVDPPIVPAGRKVLATAFTSALTDVPTEIYLVDDDGNRVDTEFKWSSAYPGRVLFWVDSSLAAGMWDIGVETADGCGSLLPDAFEIGGASTIDVDKVEPKYAWTFDYTNVQILGLDPTPTSKIGFEDTPRLYLTPHATLGTAAPVQGVSFKNENELTAVVPYGLEAGWYDLIVLNPDGALGVLEYAVQINNQPPPEIDSLSPPSLPNSADVAINILGSNFRSPTVDLQCLSSGTTTVDSLTVTAWDYGSITAIVPATAYQAAVCKVLVTNSDFTYAWYSALSIRNPSENLFPWVAGPDLNEARRAPSAAAIRVSSISRYVYAFGGDQGDLSTPLATSERAPVSPYGEIGTWEYTKPLREPRTGAASATIGRFVYLMGGWNGTKMTEMVWRAQALDPVDVPHFDDLQLKTATTGLGAGTWTYRVVAYYDTWDTINPDGMSLPGDPVTVKLPEASAPFHVTIEWTAVDRAVGYRVFRTPAADAPAGDVEWVADVTTTSFTDTGYATTADKYELSEEGDLGNWMVVAYLNTFRYSACVAVAPDPNPDPEVHHIYVAGGIDRLGNYLDSIEVIPVTVLSDHEQEVPPVATLLSDKLSTARAECVGFTVDSSLHSVVSPGETYVYFAGGRTASRAVGNVDSGLVAAGGDLDPYVQVDDMSPARAGFGGAAASDFLYAFGGHGGSPSNTGVSSELDGLLLPNLVNWNSLAKKTNEPRYLPGFAQESAVMFLVGGTTDTTDATQATEYTNF